MKQSKLRRRRVIRYAILYFTLLVVFIAIVAGPAVVGKLMGEKLSKTLQGMIPMDLVQPNYLEHDNTNSSSVTGIKNPTYSGALLTMTGHSKFAEASATGKIKLF